MHRTKVTVVEEALDANNTIARANRLDFDRASVKVINFMSAPGAGKTALLERVVAHMLVSARTGEGVDAWRKWLMGVTSREREELLLWTSTQR